MILPSVLALGAQFLMPVSESVPVLNVEAVCQGIAQQGGATFRDSAVARQNASSDPAIAKEKKNCIDSELEVRDELAKEWSSFTPTDRISCVNESRMGGESSYTELITCLEMARDVRAMRAEEGESDMPRPARRRR
jgi:hypothetical protein